MSKLRRFEQFRGGKRFSYKALASFDAKLALKVNKFADKNKVKLVIAAYCVLNKISRIPKCRCGSEIIFNSFDKGFRQSCSPKCAQSDTRVREKSKQTNLAIYGHESPVQCKKVKEKRKKTCQIRYGGNAPSSSKTVKDKIKATCLNKYGVDNPAKSKAVQTKATYTILRKYGGVHFASTSDVIDKKASTCLKRYGVPHQSRTKRFKERYEKTSIERYGERHFMLNPDKYEEFTKNLKTNYEYKIHGKSFLVRGYEKHALEYIVRKKGVKVKHIVNTVSDGLPSFTYNKNRRYYPDFYLPKANIVVEVKSTYTVGCTDKALFKINRKKAKAVAKAGYRYKLLVFNKDGHLIKCFKNFHEVSFNEVSCLV